MLPHIVTAIDIINYNHQNYFFMYITLSFILAIGTTKIAWLCTVIPPCTLTIETTKIILIMYLNTTIALTIGTTKVIYLCTLTPPFFTINICHRWTYSIMYRNPTITINICPTKLFLSYTLTPTIGISLCTINLFYYVNEPNCCY